MADEAKISDSLDYIEMNLSSKLRLEDLSGRVFLSKYHYHRLFHRLTGEPVKRYINKRRMAAAAQELICSDARILDIAIKYQFSSQEAFTRAFKRVYDTTPAEYRRLYAIGTTRLIGRGGHQITGMAA
jgi:AraC-like DNA-binding protein